MTRTPIAPLGKIYIGDFCGVPVFIDRRKIKKTAPRRTKKPGKADAGRGDG